MARGQPGSRLQDSHGTVARYAKHKCRCSPCVAAASVYNRARYNKDSLTDKERRRARREWLQAIKSVPCSDCGGQFPPECMDFDHRPGTDKQFTIGARISHSVSRLVAEIEKCDIVCANCHRIRTYQRLREKGLAYT